MEKLLKESREECSEVDDRMTTVQQQCDQLTTKLHKAEKEIQELRTQKHTDVANLEVCDNHIVLRVSTTHIVCRKYTMKMNLRQLKYVWKARVCYCYFLWAGFYEYECSGTTQ